MRHGATLVEMAVIASVFFTLLLGMVVVGMGVYQYNQVAALAREGARYASVRGAQYARDTGNTAATAQDIYNNAILPRAAALDTSKLSNPPAVSWADSSKLPLYYNYSTSQWTRNTVSVTVTYQWSPPFNIAGITGTYTMTSTSVLPITN